ncbi:MAG: CsbD family protein [Desulfuromonadales bacterium]|nr:CsbD family protein [Desulfuromonadales bacterium]
MRLIITGQRECGHAFSGIDAAFLQTNWKEKSIITRLEESMKSSVRDKAEGRLHEAKGKVKEVAGKITGSPKLEAEGKAEKIAGKVQGKVGEVKEVLGE